MSENNKSERMSIPFLTVSPEEDDLVYQRQYIAAGMPIPPSAMLRPSPLRDEALRLEALELAEEAAQKEQESGASED